MFGILTYLLSCLKSTKCDRSPPQSETEAVTHKSCKFCRISPENGFDVIWEDEAFVAFNDYKPAARHHILIIPRPHTTNVRHLRKSATGLVRSMEKIGHQLLDDRAVPAPMRRMGFHISPFNSIEHLHLHVHGLPYKPMRRSKYPIATGKSPRQKGLSWFAEVGQTIRILENDGHVGVLPC